MSQTTPGDVVDWLVTNLQSIAELDGKVLPVLTKADVLRAAKTIPFPGLGVVYEGMTKREDVPKGASVEFHVSLVMFYKVEGILGQTTGEAYRVKAMALLSDVRHFLLNNVGPNSKWWHFDSELSPVNDGILTLWIQQWSLPMILT